MIKEPPTLTSGNVIQIWEGFAVPAALRAATEGDPGARRRMEGAAARLRQMAAAVRWADGHQGPDAATAFAAYLMRSVTVLE